MDLTTKIFNFILGLSGQAMEEADKMKTTLEKEYSRILSIGANNNSDPAIALRETTETVIVFFEDLRFKLHL